MTYQLSVNGNDLRNGLKYFKSRRKIRSYEKAVLAFDGHFFSIEALDKTIAAHAEGVWPGIAYVSASVILAFATAPPTEDPILLSCDGEHLRFGSLKVGCEWQPVSHTLMKIKAAPDWVDALSLKYRAKRAQLISGKHLASIAAAEKTLTKLIKECAKKLSPLGISDKDIRLLIEDRLEKRYADKKQTSKE